MDGFLLIDKPAGWTSHDVVAYLRRLTGVRQIGHAGTLDPFATGLLIIGIGVATKKLSDFMKLEKEYLAEIQLGAVSDTDDSTGKIQPVADTSAISRSDVEKILPRFLGEIEQVPPMYSAKKIRGQKLYELARQGKTVERQPAKVLIKKIDLLSYGGGKIKIRVVCGSGTYIRALARDIGQALGTGAYCQELRRIGIGEYRVEEALTPEQVTFSPALF